MKQPRFALALRQGMVFLSLLICSNASPASVLGTKIDEPLLLRRGNKADWARTTGVNLVGIESNRKKLVTTLVAAPTIPTEKKIKVMIDAGHGGKDLGAVGVQGITEKDICLKISKGVVRELERMENTQAIPFDVVLTRDSDVFIPLKDRVKMANDWGADLFVSIHANSSPYPKAHGFEVYFLSTEGSDEEARRLALAENAGGAAPVKSDVLSILSDVQTNFHIEHSSYFAEEMFSAISRKVLSSGRAVRQGPFTVLAGTAMPAILIEVGYLTHSQEVHNLTKESYLKRLAGAISTGIADFATKRKKPGKKLS
jgi:N-acetylmuramoyl-L-alanine amidase